MAKSLPGRSGRIRLRPAILLPYMRHSRSLETPLLGLKRRGLDVRSELAIADGGLGLWEAAGMRLQVQFPRSAELASSKGARG
jgi:hypothetical protein